MFAPVKVVIVAIVFFFPPFPPCFGMGSAGFDMCLNRKSLGFFQFSFLLFHIRACVCGGGYIIFMRIRPSVKRTGVSTPGFSLSVDASRQKGKRERDKEDREKMVFWVDGGRVWRLGFKGTKMSTGVGRSNLFTTGDYTYRGNGGTECAHKRRRREEKSLVCVCCMCPAPHP